VFARVFPCLCVRPYDSVFSMRERIRWLILIVEETRKNKVKVTHYKRNNTLSLRKTVVAIDALADFENHTVFLETDGSFGEL